VATANNNYYSRLNLNDQSLISQTHCWTHELLMVAGQLPFWVGLLRRQLKEVLEEAFCNKFGLKITVIMQHPVGVLM
jgi:hypothetical protein